MPDKRSLILTHEDVAQKTTRIAYQILEDNYDAKELVLVGLQSRGYEYAKRLAKELKTIGDCKILLHSIKVNKADPLKSEIEKDFDQANLAGKTVILVDDVANTGRTLFYALNPLSEGKPEKIRIAVLVDRKHKLFPICSDYVGLSLSTTMQEHITVEFKSKADAVYLS